MTKSLDRRLEAQLAAETDRIATTTRSIDREREFEAFFSEVYPEFRRE